MKIVIILIIVNLYGTPVRKQATRIYLVLEGWTNTGHLHYKGLNKLKQSIQNLSDFIFLSVFVLFDLFNDVSTRYVLFNAEIWFISKCLKIFFDYNQYFMASFYLFLIIFLTTVIWYQRFLSNKNNLYTVVWL